MDRLRGWLACLAMPVAMAGFAQDQASTWTAGQQVPDHYQSALWNPSPELLDAERRGRVTIYDRLRDETVERALDRQFDRIESMMFVRTRPPEAESQYEASDDCD